MSDSTFEFGAVHLAAVCIAVAAALVSVFCTLLQLWLIKDMQRWNEYLQLVVTITLCQLLYSIGFLFLPFYKIEICFKLIVFLVSAGNEHQSIVISHAVFATIFTVY